MRRKAFMTALIFFFLSMGYSTPRPDGAPLEKYERTVIEHFSRGDYKSLYLAIREMLFAYPVHPVSALYFRDLARFADIMGTRTINADLRNLREKMTGPGDEAVRNLCRLIVDLELEKLLFHREPYESKKITDTLAPVKKWLLLGPYEKSGADDLMYPFIPETAPGSPEAREKSRSLLLKNFDSSLKIHDYLYPERGAAYAVTSFKTAAPVRIRIYSRSHYRVFINGKEVLKNDSREFRNLRILRVWDTAAVTLMIKCVINRDHDLRVIVTDDLNAVVPPEGSLGETHGGTFRHQEIHDFPYHSFLPEVRGRAGASVPGPDELRYLGIYFSERDSHEAAGYFRKSLLLRESPFTRYLLAAALLDDSDGDVLQVHQDEGWRIIKGLVKSDPGFIPARTKRFQDMVSRKDYESAYREGESILALAPQNAQIHMDYLELLSLLGFQREFEQRHEGFYRMFPYSILPLMSLAEFHRKRNSAEFCRISEKISQERYADKYGGELVRRFISGGEYRKALAFLERYGHTGDHTGELMAVYMGMKNYAKARETILKKLAAGEKPSLYYALGLIDSLENSDPLLYWEKMLSLNPSLISYTDLVRYLGSGKLENPLDRYLEKPGSMEELLKVPGEKGKAADGDSGGHESEILFRGRLFLLNRDGSGRAFCEDIVYLRGQKGIDSWGEYRVPYRGEIHPVRVRTYFDGGGYSDSYRIRKVNGGSYINLNSLRKESIVQISYLIDNPRSIDGNPLSLAHPPELLQNYDEPVRALMVRVVAPEEIPLDFRFRDSWTVKRENAEGSNIYTVRARDLGAVRREKQSGSDMNSLPFFAFSAMRDPVDFIRWYSGLLEGRDRFREAADLAFLKKEGAAGTIRSVYDQVAHRLALTGNALYYPEHADDTWSRKSGTGEDKVILAKAILEGLGIESHIAFSTKIEMPDFGSFISPHVFTSILLHVPVEGGRGYWLDFSDQHFPFGAVDPGLRNARALVFRDNSFEVMTIEGSEKNGTEGNYVLTVDSRGDAEVRASVVFFGARGNVRKYLSDRLSRDDMVGGYFTAAVSGLEIADYSIEGREDHEKPLGFTVAGRCTGLVLAGSDRMILQPILKKNGVYQHLLYEKRDHPLIMAPPADEAESYRYILPREYLHASVEKVHGLSGRFGTARVVISKKRGDGVLSVTKEVRFLKTRIDPGEYREFMEYCLKLKEIEYTSVVFRRE